MTQGFVWFHNSSDKPSDSSSFYEKLLGWKPSEGPGGMTMLVGDSGPFAGIAQKDAGAAGWIPYAQVDDVDAATKKAHRLGVVSVNWWKRVERVTIQRADYAATFAPTSIS